MERVQKIIAEAGFCSRRKAEELIAKGLVLVNGKRITIGDKADASKDQIMVGKQRIEKTKKVYLMLNKPKGFITTASDMFSRKKVTDLVKDVDFRVFPVGRLDRDATGLLLMTNDGEWANKMMHPRYKVEKEYLVELNDRIDRKVIAEMNKGFYLKDGKVRPSVKMIKKNYCSLSVQVGKNKIVKRIFNHFGFRVLQLRRVRVGKYRLGKLRIGEWKFIRP